jgi:hypothetical protein
MIRHEIEVLVVPNLAGRWAYKGKLIEDNGDTLVLDDACIVTDYCYKELPFPNMKKGRVVLMAKNFESIFLLD